VAVGVAQANQNRRDEFNSSRRRFLDKGPANLSHRVPKLLGVVSDIFCSNSLLPIAIFDVPVNGRRQAALKIMHRAPLQGHFGAGRRFRNGCHGWGGLHKAD
jgi:hypothetical protein